MELQSEMPTPRRKREKALSIEGFRLKHEEQKWGICERAAHFFEWAKTKYPYRFWPWNIVYKAVTMSPHTPRLNSIEVIALRKRSSVVRRYIRQKYGSDLKCMNEVGVGSARSIVDGEDMVQEALPGAITRFDRARRNLVEVHGLVKESEVKSKNLLDYYRKQSSQLVRSITAPDFIARLALPAMPVEGGGKNGTKE